MTDVILFICLICSLVCLTIYKANKYGYAFTIVDTVVMCLLGITAFIVPYMAVGFISSIIF